MLEGECKTEGPAATALLSLQPNLMGFVRGSKGSFSSLPLDVATDDWRPTSANSGSKNDIGGRHGERSAFAGPCRPEAEEMTGGIVSVGDVLGRLEAEGKPYEP